MQQRTIVIGAGPGGLTAAYLLTKRGLPVLVLEADPKYVGGISRTEERDGFRFDIGGHRFFSKSQEVTDLWKELLPDDLIERPRFSRIYYRGRFFDYPLRPLNAFLNLGAIESLRCVGSYAMARLSPHDDPRSLDQWVTNAFGKRLFEIFFETYTEKVWGMKCSEISADWAAQRIKGLSLGEAIKNALLRPKKTQVKSLIDSFWYPKLGPGMMWDAAAARVRAGGNRVELGRRVVEVVRDDSRGVWRVTSLDASGAKRVDEAEHVISSAPLRELVAHLTPALSDDAQVAARALRYRDFVIVALATRAPPAFLDNWIYLHDGHVRAGRIQNFGSWSPHMVPDPAYACYGLEYFAFEGDGIWESSDDALIELASSEIATIGLVKRSEIEKGYVVRQRKAYPVYDAHYAAHVDVVRRELATRFPTLHLIGRNGMHKYNNQDHSMMTAMLTVENIVAGRAKFDTWQVNSDAEYHEDGESASTSGLRAVPTRLASEPL